MRQEADALGPVAVPFDALYGAQTARAIVNFPISGTRIGRFPGLLCALARIKIAAARANARLGALPAEKAATIEKVCAEIIAGQHHQHFPVDVFQGGAGTSTNMNMNEVIANRGLELMGHPCGSYAHLHPNDDVNRSQSTNDVYPTAIRIALMSDIPLLMTSLSDLAAAFEAKGAAFAGIAKLGRTELQDAVPMTLGAEMRAYGTTLREDVDRLRATVGMLAEINLGGTAIGTGVAAPEGYREAAFAELVALTGLPLKPAADLMEASWDAGVFVHVSGVLKRVATKLSKIANDLRLLSSGPRGGLGEIRLPPMQPGSSIMPGKVNPVICEMVNQVAFHVIGADVTISFAAEAGQLQLNAFEPIMAFELLQSVALLRNAAEVFRLRCIDGIEADADRCRRNLEASTAYFAELVPEIGYENASQLARQMLADGQSWTDVVAGLQRGDGA
ncbi:aspartate ammonia-lyase [Tabrizicola oligotrophica]|uniref:aspartate ammonia-lyase n=1 Tax=Tabrizicola oligotrophica TaxID=2710650 RepID=UPI002AB25489|nr:aspartate ammonia-lyase [Tabrizicola oligotrophica]